MRLPRERLGALLVARHERHIGDQLGALRRAGVSGQLVGDQLRGFEVANMIGWSERYVSASVRRMGAGVEGTELKASNPAERMPLVLFAFFLVFVGVGFLLPVLRDGDTWWHLGAGRWIAENLAVPDRDPFSHSRPGIAWHAHEWGSELIMWSVYSWGGLAALVVLTALAAALAVALLADFVQSHLPSWVATLVTLAAASSLLPGGMARPHLIALPFLVFWVATLVKAADLGRSPPLSLSALMVIWANLHGSFLLGLLLIIPIGIEASLASENRRAAIQRWSLFGGLSIAAALLTPLGTASFYFPFQIASMDALQHIQEWRPSLVGRDPLFFGSAVGAIAIFLSLGVRFSPVRALVWSGLLLMALSHARHQLLFGFVGWLLAARPLGIALAKWSKPPAAALGRLDRVVITVLTVASGLAVLVRVFLPVSVNEGHRLPLTLIALVPPDLRQTPVFNEYSFGGPLIFLGIRPFIDGRADMYGDAFVSEYVSAFRGDADAWERISNQYRVQWTILPPASPLVRRLERAGWRQILADGRAVIHLSPDATASTVRNEERR